jgi:Rieske Fe-S protein
MPDRDPSVRCDGACASLFLTPEAEQAAAGGIGRRTFLMQSAILAAAAALAACAGAGGPTAPSIGGGGTINVASYTSLANVGGIAMVNVNGAGVAVVRTGAATFIALSRTCPHQGGTIGQFGNGFQCPNHGATFNSQGQWIGGQPASNMFAYSTLYNAVTGVLTIS